jgi:hypothetical protein
MQVLDNVMQCGPNACNAVVAGDVRGRDEALRVVRCASRCQKEVDGRLLDEQTWNLLSSPLD